MAESVTLPMPIAAPFAACAGAYLSAVAKRTGSLRTATEYGKYLARFVRQIPNTMEATPADVFAFCYGKGARGTEPSPSTVGVRLAAIRGFFEFARKMGLIAVNPAIDVPRPKDRTPAPRGLTADELRQLLGVLPATPTGATYRALVILSALTGVRRAEALAITKADITIEANVVYFTFRAKGGVVRKRELPAPVWTAIKAALDANGRPFEDLDAGERLFPLGAFAWWAAVKRYAKKAGLKDVTPHVLRHSAAKLRRDAGASIEDVSELLGHQSIATTATYLRRLEGARDYGWQAAAAALGV
jgi:integrase/recombinase XerD